VSAAGSAPLRALPPTEPKLRSRLKLSGCINSEGGRIHPIPSVRSPARNRGIGGWKWLRLVFRNDPRGRSEHCEDLPRNEQDFPANRHGRVYEPYGQHLGKRFLHEEFFRRENVVANRDFLLSLHPTLVYHASQLWIAYEKHDLEQWKLHLRQLLVDKDVGEQVASVRALQALDDWERFPSLGDNGHISKISVSDFLEDPKSHENIIGDALLRRITGRNSPARVVHVHFAAGAKTRPHFHKGRQILWFLEGSGEVGSSLRKVFSCGPGEIVRVDPYVDHWHGAAETDTTSHLAITVGDTVWEGEPDWHQRHGYKPHVQEP
jgi:quercetin dioxygenase-like cupin family protein